ncbi:acyl-CoA N-acyltransferase [Metschnikowia bicuspidata var. bicuspidata NRRL YB-4993]|uniref:histone acetyltransferase n=1 Tax=Metschnikowia bicuspidata var. bicuspidata NRRL YB-4993 TaxID=869754 RepID=A0A1A0HJI0_9ASCO|nr:acyl-CoA N-acyltransferase [Metschnikowia bicuspidata var. bicuspidata NRRL YB-4993]OBA24156.1 acyl-CoA N-acyltransferase [Metschnikowia bicuspidata var. bicuspidata NRRL YB-4993]
MQKNPPLHVGDSQHASRHDVAEYGRLESRNIGTVTFGDYVIDTWYGNSAYFQNFGDSKLGVDPEVVHSRRRGFLPVKPGFWVDNLYVCDSCFKYTLNAEHMAAHAPACPLQKRFPPLGKVVYVDKRQPYVIKKVRGYRHPLFCQNLALFGKLFLDDKLVFYNVEAFDFHVLYGHVPGARARPAGHLSPLKPMGFFSAEVNSYELDTNLACICIFPPFQRLGLGSLLIEFLYAMARVTPGQQFLGPEYPLLPFGRRLYLRFWARRLAFAVFAELGLQDAVTLLDLARLTGFRKEDVLVALEYMGVLQRGGPGDAEATLLVSSTRAWCDANGVDPKTLHCMLDPDGVLV